MADDAPTPAVISYPAKAGGVLTRVLECGEGDGVVVFLHGSGARADRFRANLAGLAALGWHCFAVDFPGHGFASKLPEHRYDTASFAEMVGDVVEDLGVADVALVGTSLGAHVAATYACAAPERVRAAVLVGALGLVPVVRDASQTSARIADTSEEGIRAKLKMLLCDRSLVTAEWVREERRVNTSPGAEGALGSLRSYLAGKVNDELVGPAYASLGIPTLLVWGAEDAWVAPRYGLEAREVLGGAPLVYLERTGHVPYLERAADFDALVHGFLSDPAAFPREVVHR